MAPFMIAAVQPLTRRFGSIGIAFEPAAHVIVIKLFAPEKSRECLAHDVSLISRDVVGNYRAVEVIRFRAPLGEKTLEIPIERRAARW